MFQQLFLNHYRFFNFFFFFVKNSFVCSFIYFIYFPTKKNHIESRGKKKKKLKAACNLMLVLVSFLLSKCNKLFIALFLVSLHSPHFPQRENYSWNSFKTRLGCPVTMATFKVGLSSSSGTNSQRVNDICHLSQISKSWKKKNSTIIKKECFWKK